ncbi:SDR family NAD(P)-dependent oxidoreductase [Embleya sp. NPDC059237]|uniref:SDR family NAD(P)-dependent oxidoreductase n=1 Tax=Embleya sp. NPDC059237 TaxID=3346784 RepID=UPI0036B7544E
MASVLAPSSATPARREAVAVIGAGCRFPGGVDSPSSLWRLLCAGIDTAAGVPPDRWSFEELGDVEPAVVERMRWGCYLDSDIRAFDPAAFGIGAEEAAWVDPQHRLFLEVAWEAFEYAGIPVVDLSGSRTGVFAGVYSDDYLLRNRPRPEEVSAYYGLTSMHSTMVGRVSFQWNLQGPSVAVDTACSSSLVAVHLACQSLRTGESDLTLAGGVQLVQTPEQMVASARWEMLSPRGRCRSFDAGADGFVRGEGCGVLVLKRLADAQRDGDRILAVLRGSAVNQDGHSSRLTAPSQDAQEQVFRAALQAADVRAANVGMVEGHGPGTPVGDPVEFAATAAVYGLGRGRCALGSIKSNIGHTEPAAGVAGLLKAILAVRHGVIPPTLHFQRWNQDTDAEGTRLFVPVTTTDWPVDGTRLAAVSGYGIGGTNAHVIVEQPPEATVAQRTGVRPRAEVVALSANSAAALSASAGRLADWLTRDGDEANAALADVAYTLAVRRSHGAHRLAVVSRSRAELEVGLRAHVEEAATPTAVSGRVSAGVESGPVWVFSGQGSQWAGMGRSLLEQDEAFDASMRELEPLIEAEGGPVLGRVLADVSVVSGFARVQPVLFAVQVSLSAMWRAHGVRPAAVIGHSTGEIAAAVAAGALSLADGAAIVCRRSRLAARLSAGGAMASVRLGQDTVLEELGRMGAEQVGIGVVASPDTTVIAGDRGQVKAAVEQWQAAGVTAALVAVDVASHSPAVDPVLPHLRAELSGLRPRVPHTAFYGAVLPDPREVPAFDADYWVRNLREPVRFASAVAAAAADGHRAFVEVSPHPLLTSAITECLAQATSDPVLVTPTLWRDQDEERTFATQLARLHCFGAAVDWSRRYPPGRLTDVPTTTWDRKPFVLAPTRVRSSDGAAGEEHPLLGAHLCDPQRDDRHLWQTTVGVQRLPWLADHTLEQVPVLPATGMCEGAVAAACALFDAGPEAVEVGDLVLYEVLPLADSPRITTTATRRSSETASWVLSTQDAAGSRTVHATATLRRVRDEPRPDGLDIASLRSRHTRPLDVDVFQQALTRRGITHGPSFAALRRMHRHDGDVASVLAEPALPGQARAGASRMHWHPVLFDACLQAAMALWDSCGLAGAGMIVPISIASVRVCGRAARGRYCLAELTDGGADGFTATVRWLGDDGDLLAEARGVRFLRTEVPAHSTLFDSCLLQVQWLEAPLPDQVTDGHGSWLLIGESPDDALAADLATHLRARGDACHVAFCAPDLAPRAATAHLARALATRDDWTGVAVLPGRERTTVDEHTPRMAQQRTTRLGLLARALVAAAPAEPPRLWVVTRNGRLVDPADRVDPHQAGMRGLVRVLGYEHAEYRPTGVDIDLLVGAADLADELQGADPGDDELAWRNRRRLRARLVKSPMRDDERRRRLCRYARDGFALAIRSPGNLGTFEFVPRPRRAPGAGEIEVRVLANSLNFVDVFLAMGIYPSEDPALGDRTLGMGGAPTLEWGGMDCGGVVVAVGEGVDAWRAGDRVIVPLAGFGGGFASFVTVRADWAYPVPADMPLESAVAMPTAYVTAWYSLVRLARVGRGESVLIHSAAGGVGLAAIHLARFRGARVLATAGTDAKRKHLRSLGIEDVFDSRSLDFADQVRRATGGRGVDVVLNCLTGEAQRASLDLVAPQGRFVEIGKKDIYADNPLGLYAFRRNITFHSVDMALLSRIDPDLVARLTREVARELAEGRLAVLPCTTFPVADASTAFRTMANAEHIGKIVLAWPGDDEARVVCPPDAFPLARPDGAYIITGGLGGLGLLFAEYLAGKGAGHLVLNSRRQPRPHAREVIDRITAGATRVSVVTGDLADPHTADRLVRVAENGFALRGVLHGAAVVEDATAERFDPDLLDRVWLPKAVGAWRLHEATKQHSPDWWVGFSSTASLFGSPGQGPYAAANAWLDEFLAWRAAQGHPETTTIQWGLWGEVGAGAEAALRYAAIAPAEGVPAFEYILSRGRHRTGYNRTELTDWLASFATVAGTSFFSGLLDGDARDSGPRPTGVLAALRAATDDRQRRALLHDLVTGHLAAILRWEADLIVDGTTLTSLGLDSLMGLELRNRLERDLDTPVPRVVVWTSPTVATLVDAILTQVGAG